MRFFLLVALLAAAPVRAQGALSDRIEDLRRTATVRAALALEAQTRPYDVGVTTEGGVVTLVGVVGTMGARERAEALARDVGGVRLVRNNLRIEGQPDVPVTRAATDGEAAGRETEEEASEPEALAEEREPAPAEPLVPEVRTAYHTVGRGDTLYSVARRYGTTVPELQRLNNLRTPDAIRIGQRLRVR